MAGEGEDIELQAFCCKFYWMKNINKLHKI